MNEQETRPIEDPVPAVQEGAPAESELATNASSKPAESVPECLPDQQTAPPEAEAQTSTERLAEPTDAESIAAAEQAANAAVLAASRKHTRRAFVAAAAGAAAGYGFYHWIANSRGVQMQPGPLRRAFQTNASISRAIMRDHALTPTYKLSEARDLRVNGVFGLKQELAPESWRLQVVGSTAGSNHPSYTRDVTAWEYRYTSAANPEDPGHDTKVDPQCKDRSQNGSQVHAHPGSGAGRADRAHAARSGRGRREPQHSDARNSRPAAYDG